MGQAREYAQLFRSLNNKSQEMIFSYFVFNRDKEHGSSEKFCEALEQWFKNGKKEFRSPIEETLYITLFLVAYETSFRFENCPKIVFQTQKKIEIYGSTYFADLYFDSSDVLSTNENRLKLVVECDGHEFHERTKEQVIKGNKRDYDLRYAGYDVLHFSGSQIYNKPLSCAFDIVFYIYKKLGIKQKEQN